MKSFKKMPFKKMPFKKVNLFKKRKKAVILAGMALCVAVVGFLIVPRIVSAGAGMLS